MKKPSPVSRIDLNLLRVFDAVMEDRNLLRAGKRLHLSQSAVSHGITRLREALNDELFVRTARGMEPTVRAMEMAGPIRHALHSIHETLGEKPFVPDDRAHRFVIAANDFVTMVLITPLLKAVALCAPRVDFVIRPSTRLDLAEQLDVGRIDIAVGVFSELPARYRAAPIWTQFDHVVMRENHPLLQKPLTPDSLAEYPLLTVSLGGQADGAVSGYIVERGLGRQSDIFDRAALEQAMNAAGARAHYQVTVPHALAIPSMLAGSDLVSIVPGQLAQAFKQGGGLDSRPVPYASAGIMLRAIWHECHDEDPAHLWLRNQLKHAVPNS